LGASSLFNGIQQCATISLTINDNDPVPTATTVPTIAFASTRTPTRTFTPTPRPTATRTPTVTSSFTSTVALSTWYISCNNLTGPLRVRSGVEIGTQFQEDLPIGTQVIRPDLIETSALDFPQYIRIRIYYPLGQQIEIAYVTIRDLVANDGEYLDTVRDPVCPTPAPTLPPTATPTATATFDPTYPRYSPGRFDDNVGTILSVFGNEPPAVMGVLEIHPDIDLVPLSMEQCIDATAQLSNCLTEQVAVYAPVSGCLYRTQLDQIELIINCESINTYPDGRREVYFTHLDPNRIPNSWQLNTFYYNIQAGALLGYLCSESNKGSCGISANTPVHLAVNLRFWLGGGQTIPATNEEFLGFISTPSCLFDIWLANAFSPTLNPNPLNACPA